MKLHTEERVSLVMANRSLHFIIVFSCFFKGIGWNSWYIWKYTMTVFQFCTTLDVVTISPSTPFFSELNYTIKNTEKQRKDTGVFLKALNTTILKIEFVWVENELNKGMSFPIANSNEGREDMIIIDEESRYVTT